MADITVHHLGEQEFVKFELSSREPMEVSVAYLGQTPEGKASLGIQIRYAGETE